MRTIGLSISLVVCVACTAGVVAYFYGLLVWETGFALAAGVSLGLALFWWRIVNAEWVRSAANDYAERLLDALDVLPLPPQENSQGSNPASQT
ncbi:hypothetical protein AB0C93_35275 [Streptomyces sp. NPDC048518]|uniref:hypothetical protein n=1 Tax=Streptomyces sp. NPDC048518 TaxID=3155029 RepID=UPI0033D4AA99